MLYKEYGPSPADARCEEAYPHGTGFVARLFITEWKCVMGTSHAPECHCTELALFTHGRHA